MWILAITVSKPGIALIAALVGGIVVKVLDYFISRKEIDADEATKIREELMAETKHLAAEIDVLRLQLVEGRTRYYALLAEYESLKLEFEELRLNCLEKYSEQ